MHSSQTKKKGTIIRNLNSSCYKYLQSCKEGLMTHKDIKLRLAYCKDIKKKKLGKDVWCNDIAFYLNGIGFEFKMNLLDQARVPGARVWQKPTEGLDINCVAKGKKERCVYAKFTVGISHGKGVLFCKQLVQKYYALHVQGSIYCKWPRRETLFSGWLPPSECSSSLSILGPNGMWVGKHTINVFWS